MFCSRFVIPAAALAAALLLAACGAAAPSSTVALMPTAVATSAEAGRLAPPLSLEGQDSAPTAIPTAAPSAIPTPAAITIGLADRFQVVRESYSPERLMKNVSLSISPDGHLAAVAGCEPEEDDICYDRTVLRLVDIDTGATLFDLKPLSPVVERMSFSPDGSMLAVAGCDLPLYLVGEMDTICDDQRLWTVDTATGETLYELGDFRSSITSLVWSPDGARLYSGVQYLTQYNFVDNEISVFDTASGERLGIIEPATTNCSKMRLDPSADGRFLVLDLAGDCGHPSFVQWWDVQDITRPSSVHQEVPANLHRLSPDGKHILTVNSIDNSLRAFELETGETVASFPAVARQFRLGDLQYLDPDRLLLEIDSGWQILDLATGESEPAPLPALTRTNKFVLADDGRTMLTYGYIDSDGLVKPTLSLWDTTTWQEAAIPAYAFHDPFGHGGQPRFSDDQTRRVQPQSSGVSFVVWGSRPPEQADALQVLQEYLGHLAAGEYAEAANQLVLEETPAWNALVLDRAYVADLVPEVNPGDTEALLEVLCTDSEFPCAPVRDVTLQAQVDEDTYLFAVPSQVLTARLPNGRPAPTCRRTCSAFGAMGCSSITSGGKRTAASGSSAPCRRRSSCATRNSRCRLG
jgi:WD40 repeat protein